MPAVRQPDPAKQSDLETRITAVEAQLEQIYAVVKDFEEARTRSVRDVLARIKQLIVSEFRPDTPPVPVPEPVTPVKPAADADTA